MKKLTVILVLFLFYNLHAQQIKFIDGSWIEKIKANTTDTIYVINFWATWCKPCVEELPDFEKLNKEFSQKNVKVILVSNDFKKQINTRLIPFVKKNNIKSEVVFMNETNPNNWIEKADKSWSGALPATMIICHSKHFYHFNEGETTYKELVKLIEPLITIK